jgi:hypothetical protein
MNSSHIIGNNILLPEDQNFVQEGTNFGNCGTNHEF